MSFVGQSPETVYGSIESRYFYALRRTDDGELFLTKIDQLDMEAVVIQTLYMQIYLQQREQGVMVQEMEMY